MATPAQVKATSKFIKNNTRRYTLQCNNEKDADIIAFLDGVDNYTKLLKDLIRAEIDAK